MKLKTILISFLLVFFLCCKNSDNNQSIPDNKSLQKYFCYIKRLYETDSANFIEVDLVNLLTGDSAIAEAKKFGDAEYEINENGDTLWFLPNDYYIMNVRIDSLKFQLDKNCKMDVWISDQSTNYQVTQKSLTAPEIFKDYIDSNKVFEIYLSENFVTTIKEFWTP
ncbi:MAG: hypothetical protein KatS3mg036_0227 [Ignavibacterium sp.]|nr:MAG: hypothetical protein KatS3mg036_0227 [Ignavibacterium sp.]